MSDWADLNKRQQTYLQSVYEVDQLQEANIKAMATRGLIREGRRNGPFGLVITDFGRE